MYSRKMLNPMVKIHRESAARALQNRKMQGFAMRMYLRRERVKSDEARHQSKNMATVSIRVTTARKNIVAD